MCEFIYLLLAYMPRIGRTRYPRTLTNLLYTFSYPKQYAAYSSNRTSFNYIKIYSTIRIHQSQLIHKHVGIHDDHILNCTKISGLAI